MTSYVSNIQRMCMQDGPGLRTTVFLKGCTLHCPWCSNPENLMFYQESYFRKDHCVRDLSVCQGEECRFYSQGCMATGVYGTCYSQEELLKELCKDEEYWRISGGGVTFSGGEALAHMDYLEIVMEQLKKKNVHIIVETALFVSEKAVKKAMQYVDLFYVDVKLLDQRQCGAVLGGDVLQYQNNVALLAGSRLPIIFRVPCNDAYTLLEYNRELLVEFLGKYQEYPVEIFRTHHMGEAKYHSLNRETSSKFLCSDEAFHAFHASLFAQGNQVSVIEI